MQTFLPYPSFRRSARVLDDKRLWKQVLESRAILAIITQNRSFGTTPTGSVDLFENEDKFSNLYLRYKNHPAVNLWRNREGALVVYHNEMLHEWLRRGHRSKFRMLLGRGISSITYINPAILGQRKFHSSHRAALLAKNLEWYSQFKWRETPKIEYIWK